jgi:hypothetical protein
LLLSKGNDVLLPLWLNFACYELKIFGDYLTLNNKIDEMPNTVESLIGYIFLRLNKEFEDDLIKKVNQV